uniref:Uncharacterized protein n=1 Tax=uncultured marine virus TaxID=186617 RepID=A0A0F7L2E3_9VIRU|nr:hypothetical protein [uncultured marine virus]
MIFYQKGTFHPTLYRMKPHSINSQRKSKKLVNSQNQNLNVVYVVLRSTITDLKNIW